MTGSTTVAIQYEQGLGYLHAGTRRQQPRCAHLVRKDDLRNRSTATREVAEMYAEDMGGGRGSAMLLGRGMDAPSAPNHPPG